MEDDDGPGSEGGEVQTPFSSPHLLAIIASHCHPADGAAFSLTSVAFREAWRAVGWPSVSCRLTCGVSLAMAAWSAELGASPRNIALSAARHGEAEVLRRWLFATDACPSMCSLAAAGGHLEALKVLRERLCPWDEETAAGAAGGGHLEVLKWARDQDPPAPWYVCRPWSLSTVAKASRYGRLETVAWAIDQGCPFDETACVEAAQRGHLDVLRLLHSKGARLDAETCSAAAVAGQIQALEYTMEAGCEVGPDTCWAAAIGGELAALQLLRARGCRWDSYTTQAASKGGHLELLQWAVAEGCPVDSQSYVAAASSDAIEVVQWLREETELEWDALVAETAARSGSLRVLRYAREEGAPWSSYVAIAAEAGGDEEVLGWLREVLEEPGLQRAAASSEQQWQEDVREGWRRDRGIPPARGAV